MYIGDIMQELGEPISLHILSRIKCTIIHQEGRRTQLLVAIVTVVAIHEFPAAINVLFREHDTLCIPGRGTDEERRQISIH